MKILIVHNRYQQRGGEDSVADDEVALLRAGGHDVATVFVSNVLVYPLVHWFGVEGLAIGTVVSQFASMLYLIVAASRHYLSHRRTFDMRRPVRV